MCPPALLRVYLLHMPAVLIKRLLAAPKRSSTETHRRFASLCVRSVLNIWWGLLKCVRMCLLCRTASVAERRWIGRSAAISVWNIHVGIVIGPLTWTHLDVSQELRWSAVNYPIIYLMRRRKTVRFVFVVKQRPWNKLMLSSRYRWIYK